MYRTLRDTGALASPVLVVAFDGWVDAGASATTAAAHLARDGETLIEFDTDLLLDYRARRPILDVVDGVQSSLRWHDLNVALVRGDRDLLVLTGPEPDHRWKGFAAAVLEIAQRFGVTRSIALGALPAATPHTRAVPLLATASDRSLLSDEDRTPEGLLRVPAAALSVVQMTLAGGGIPTAGFFAQVPHYVTAPYVQAALALIERLARALGTTFALDDLPDQARRQRTELDALVAQRPEVREHVEQLESLTPSDAIDIPMPSGDEIAEEVERFLRSTRGD